MGRRSRWSRPSRLLQRYKAAAKAAGIRDVRFHDLRHTFGTRMAAAGMPMRALQEWMGHRDYKTTLMYAARCTYRARARAGGEGVLPGAPAADRFMYS